MAKLKSQCRALYQRRAPRNSLTLLCSFAVFGALTANADEEGYAQHSRAVRLALLDVEARLLDERECTQKEIDNLSAKVMIAKKRLDDIDRKLTIVRSNLSNLN